MSWLFYAFLAAWVIHLLYLCSLSARQRQIQREMEGLRRMLDARDGERPVTTP